MRRTAMVLLITLALLMLAMPALAQGDPVRLDAIDVYVTVLEDGRLVGQGSHSDCRDNGQQFTDTGILPQLVVQLQSIEGCQPDNCKGNRNVKVCIQVLERNVAFKAD